MLNTVWQEPQDYTDLHEISVLILCNLVVLCGYPHDIEQVETFYYLLEWVRKTTESSEDTEKTATLSVPSASSVVNLLRHNPIIHPEEIKKPQQVRFWVAWRSYEDHLRIIPKTASSSISTPLLLKNLTTLRISRIRNSMAFG